MYKNYYIIDTDKFAPEFYPDVIRELEGLSGSLERLSGRDKGEIVISFLKDHCIKMNLIEKNRSLVKLMTSRALATSHLERLFESCRKNESFLTGFEACIKKHLQ